ncbi:MAG: peptidylprolyl isomerase [Maricaulaceae bacterium]
MLLILPSKPVFTSLPRFFGQLGRSFLFGLCFLGLQACDEPPQEIEDDGLGIVAARLDDQAVARVDGTTLYMSDVQRRAQAQGDIATGEALTRKDPIFQATLDDLIDQRLLALEALKRSLDQEDQTRRQLAIARERILSRMLVEKHLAEQVTDENLRKLYDAQAPLRYSGKEIRARHILVADEVAMTAVLARLDAGESFGDIARELSLDEMTQGKGGDLGYAAKGVLPKAIEKAVFSLKRGGRSEPFETGAGWHIVQYSGSRITKQPEFEDVKSDLSNFLTYEEMNALMGELSKSAQISLLNDNPSNGASGETVSQDTSDTNAPRSNTPESKPFEQETSPDE